MSERMEFPPGWDAERVRRLIEHYESQTEDEAVAEDEAVMTHKLRIAITDDDGEHLKAVYVEPGTHDFEGADLSGLCAIGVKNLRGKSFRRAILYWSNLEEADLCGCDFEAADLRGASLRGTRFVGANLRGAKLGLDNLGGVTHLEGADLSNAQLHDADLRGARYDSATRFPVNFDPEALGMVEVPGPD